MNTNSYKPADAFTDLYQSMYDAITEIATGGQDFNRSDVMNHWEVYYLPVLMEKYVIRFYNGKDHDKDCTIINIDNNEFVMEKVYHEAMIETGQILPS